MPHFSSFFSRFSIRRNEKLIIIYYAIKTLHNLRKFTASSIDYFWACAARFLSSSSWICWCHSKFCLSTVSPLALALLPLHTIIKHPTKVRAIIILAILILIILRALSIVSGLNIRQVKKNFHNNVYLRYKLWHIFNSLKSASPHQKSPLQIVYLVSCINFWRISTIQKASGGFYASDRNCLIIYNWRLSQ